MASDFGCLNTSPFSPCWGPREGAGEFPGLKGRQGQVTGLHLSASVPGCPSRAGVLAGVPCPGRALPISLVTQTWVTFPPLWGSLPDEPQVPRRKPALPLCAVAGLG